MIAIWKKERERDRDRNKDTETDFHLRSGRNGGEKGEEEMNKSMSIANVFSIPYAFYICI